MGLRQVLDVDVIAHRGAVGRGVVRPEHRHGLGGERGAEHVRDKVGLRVVRLAQLPVPRRAGGVEVAQGHEGQSVGGLVPAQRRLEGQLGLSVGVARAGGVGFVDRDRHRLPVDRRARGEDQPRHPALPHDIEESQGALQIVAVVSGGVEDRFADQGRRREVNHPVDLPRRDHLRHQAPVAEVSHRQVEAFHRLAVAGAQVVHDHRMVSRVAQPPRHHRPDVPRPAGDQKPHDPSS